MSNPIHEQRAELYSDLLPHKSPKLCDIDGCEKPCRKRARFCSMHNARIDRHGDPHITLRARGISVRDQFNMSWVPVTESGCWLWFRCCSTSDGKPSYGSIRVKDSKGKPRTMNAHKLAWLLYRGNVPSGKFVLHKCDVKCCVNPNHLYLGTQKDNMRDYWARGANI